MSDTSQRGERHLLDLLDGFLESKVLMTAFRLDVFTVLAAAPLSRPELLARLGLPSRSGGLLLDACLALELLETVDGRLQVPAGLASLLVRGPDRAFRPTTYLIDYYHEVYRALGEMDELVRTDGAASTFTLRDYFKDDVREVDPAVAAAYSQYMDATMDKIADVVLETYDFAPHRYVLDLCGGTGYFCARVLAAHPALRGGFIDVPACVSIGAERYASRPELAGRIDAIAGSVFEAALTGADAITMCRSALDWGDDAVLGVYERARRALPPGGAFLVVERMLPDEITPAARALVLRAIYFLAKSRTTRYRTPAQHVALLRRAGFEHVEVRQPARLPYASFQDMRIIVARV